MHDATAALTLQPLQRAAGALAVTLKRRETATVLDGLRQAGCLKARLPRPTVTGWADVVTLNTSGGVVGGDRLDSRVVLGTGARATVASQAAERIYRSLQPPAVVRTHLAAQRDSALEWLPQETILFDRSVLDRRLTIELAPDAWFVGVESLVFGRAAMGERVAAIRLRDRIEVRRGGTLLLHDAIRMDGAADTLLQRPAIAGGARALATLVHVAPDAQTRLEAVRAALRAAAAATDTPGHGSPAGAARAVTAGASAWDGMLLARILATDGAALRRTVVQALGALRDGRPLPRVWLC